MNLTVNHGSPLTYEYGWRILRYFIIREGTLYLA
jgi:hypothetical protein